MHECLWSVFLWHFCQLATLFFIQANDQSLPTSQTCFFQLRIPSYSSQDILAERLRYAITHCRSIDMDTYMLRDGGDYDSPQLSDDDDNDDDVDFWWYWWHVYLAVCLYGYVGVIT